MATTTPVRSPIPTQRTGHSRPRAPPAGPSRPRRVAKRHRTLKKQALEPDVMLEKIMLHRVDQEYCDETSAVLLQDVMDQLYDLSDSIDESAWMLKDRGLTFS